MRKTFTVVLTVMLCLLAFTACSNEKDEIATVSFSIPNSSRDSIAAVVSGGAYQGDIDELTWFYSATADKDSKFSYGETSCSIIKMKKSDTTFRSETGIELSRGKWSFTLYGVFETVDGTSTFEYVEESTDKTLTGTIVYQGTANDVLISGNYNDISIELSNIIPNTTCTIHIGEIKIIPKGKTEDDAVEPTTVKIGDTEYKYSEVKNTDIEDIPSGQYNIVISYVSEYSNGDTVVNASASLETVIGTLQKCTIEGTFNEETSSVYINGIFTDLSMGNVYDLDENKYYWLVEVDGEYIFKTDKDSSDTVEPTVNHNLELLDCSLSNDIPDEYITDTFETMNFSDKFKKNTLAYNYNGYTWTVYHPAVCTHTDYAALNTSLSSSGYSNSALKAGYGTKLEPYCIDSLDYFYGVYLLRSTYAYYKWTGDSKIDFSKYYYWSDLRGSFDFNGATITNQNSYVFGNLHTVDNKRSEIKNLMLNYDGFVCPLVTYVYAPTTFKNIEVSGTVFYPLSIGSFAYYLGSSGTNSASSVTFENCASDAELIALPSTSSTDTSAYNLGGFIGYTGVTTTININNSSYTGAMYKTTNSSAASNASTVTYNYVIATPSSKTVTVYEDNVKKVNSSWQIDTSNKKTYAYQDISTLDTTEKVEVAAADNATTADFYYWVQVNVSGSPKTTSGVSFIYYRATLIRVNGVAKTGSNFTTDKVKDISIEADGTTTASFNYENFKLTVGGTLGNVYRYIYVIQRNSANEIVKISRKYVAETNS